MTTYRPPALDCKVAIVDRNGVPSPYLQRFWQNLSFTAADGANQNTDVSALQASVTTINSQITTINTALSGKVAKSTFTTWASPTGTLDRTTFATYAAPTASASYDQTQIQALMNAVQNVSRRLGAVITDLKV